MVHLGYKGTSATSFRLLAVYHQNGPSAHSRVKSRFLGLTTQVYDVYQHCESKMVGFKLLQIGCRMSASSHIASDRSVFIHLRVQRVQHCWRDQPGRACLQHGDHLSVSIADRRHQPILDSAGIRVVVLDLCEQSCDVLLLVLHHTPNRAVPYAPDHAVDGGERPCSMIELG